MTEPQSDSLTAILAFDPVPRAHRSTGWTAAKQKRFIAKLAETGSVSSACKQCGMSAFGIYALRRAAGSESFRAAWAAALDHGVQSLVDVAIERARDGVAIPIVYQGMTVGERRAYNDRLLMFLLKHHMPSKYGADLHPGRKAIAPPESDEENDEEALARIEARLHSLRGDRLGQIQDEYASLIDSVRDDPARRAAWDLLDGPALDALLAGRRGFVPPYRKPGADG